MPKGVWVTMSPVRTPISDRITLKRITMGVVTELNWLTSTMKISMIAMVKASLRNSWASSWASFSPV